MKVLLAESGVTWIPYYIDRLDTMMVRHRLEQLEMLQEQPSFYWRRNMACSFEEDANAKGHILEAIGVNNVLWATDYPHPDSPWPHSQEVVSNCSRPAGRGPGQDRRRERGTAVQTGGAGGSLTASRRSYWNAVGAPPEGRSPDVRRGTGTGACGTGGSVRPFSIRTAATLVLTSALVFTLTAVAGWQFGGADSPDPVRVFAGTAADAADPPADIAGIVRGASDGSIDVRTANGISRLRVPNTAVIQVLRPSTADDLRQGEWVIVGGIDDNINTFVITGVVVAAPDQVRP